MPYDYKVLSPEQRAHFVEHGWIKIENAINPKYIDAWMSDLWVRLGWDENDPVSQIHRASISGCRLHADTSTCRKPGRRNT